MLHASLESLGAYVFVLMMAGFCCRIAWRMFWVMADRTSDYGMPVVHLDCLLARRCRPYYAVVNVGRVMVNEYEQVLSWKDII